MNKDINLVTIVSSLAHSISYGGDRLFYYMNEIRVELKKGKDVNIKDWRGWYPLHYLAYDNIDDGTITNMLIEAGSDVNVRGSDGDTPLHHTIINDNRTVLRILLAKGADTNIRNKRGQTPVEYALEYGSRKKILQIFKQYSAKGNT